jgi:hypothetical protein
MPTKTANMVETLRRVPGLFGIAPYIFMIVFGVCSFVATVILLHRLGSDPPNSFWWPFVLLFGCFVIAVVGYWVGIQLVKKITPSIPYRFLTATVWEDVSRESETKDRK